MKKYIKSAFSLDVSSLSDIDDEIFDAIQQGTTKEDIEDYLIALEDSGVIDRDEFQQLRSSAFDEFDRFVSTFGATDLETRKEMRNRGYSDDTEYSELSDSEKYNIANSLYKKEEAADKRRKRKEFRSIESSDDFVVRTPKKLDEAYLNYKSTRVSKHMPKSKQAELRKTKAGYKNEMNRLSKEYKQYIYKCVAESPALPDPDAPEETWSEFWRDNKEYKEWCFVDAVEDGLFEDTDADYAAFNKMWEQAETDMAQPYA